jgi:hypothetical protein
MWVVAKVLTTGDNRPVFALTRTYPVWEIVHADSADVDELERQVSDSANEDERPQTDTDVS